MKLEVLLLTNRTSYNMFIKAISQDLR